MPSSFITRRRGARPIFSAWSGFVMRERCLARRSCSKKSGRIRVKNRINGETKRWHRSPGRLTRTALISLSTSSLPSRLRFAAEAAAQSGKKRILASKLVSAHARRVTLIALSSAGQNGPLACPSRSVKSSHRNKPSQRERRDTPRKYQIAVAGRLRST